MNVSVCGWWFDGCVNGCVGRWGCLGGCDDECFGR